MRFMKYFNKVIRGDYFGKKPNARTPKEITREVFESWI